MNYQIDLDIGITAEQVREHVITDALPHAGQAQGITLTINGFGADSRELWQIAEVCAFMRTLVEEGMLSVLKMPQFEEDGSLVINHPMGFGALEVFLMSRNMNLSGMNVSRNLVVEFLAAVYRANDLIVERYGSLDGRSAFRKPDGSSEDELSDCEEAIEQVLDAGEQAVVGLHAKLDIEEIQRAVARYRGRNVTFVLAECTAEEREQFIKRWKAAGGTAIGKI